MRCCAESIWHLESLFRHGVGFCIFIYRSTCHSRWRFLRLVFIMHSPPCTTYPRLWLHPSSSLTQRRRRKRNQTDEPFRCSCFHSHYCCSDAASSQLVSPTTIHIDLLTIPEDQPMLDLPPAHSIYSSLWALKAEELLGHTCD